MTDELFTLLRAAQAPVVAVSGGVDSQTLAAAAARENPSARMAHAVSPAVPKAATARVKALAQARGWALTCLDAGEFSDPAYLANPVDRCFHCKTNLYASLSRLGPGEVFSGANLDDLDDWRPGLRAAADHGVRHPYVEAGLRKTDVRALARDLGLGDVADMPASPCLSSRIETGLPVTQETLGLVERVEVWLREVRGARTARCRVRPWGLELELGAPELAREDDGVALVAALRRACPQIGERAIRVAPYRRGSAFTGDKAAVAT